MDGNPTKIYQENPSALTSGDYIEKQKEHLCSLIDPNSGILTKLKENGVITIIELIRIQSTRDNCKRIAIIIELVCEKKFYNEFIRALADSDHKHVANLILAKGEHKPEFGGEWPLTQQEVRIVNFNQECLVDLLDIRDLIDRFYSYGVINARQRDFISSKQPAYEKNEALLDILRRSSLNAYWQTIRCLYESNQSHIAEILAERGVSARVDAYLEGDELNVSQEEAEVIKGITNLLGNQPLPERSRIYELVQLSLAGVSLGHSVSLYFHYFWLSDLKDLQHMIENGRLKDIVETVFNRFTKSFFSVKLKSNVESFQKCRKFFEDCEKDKESVEEDHLSSERCILSKTCNLMAGEFQQHIGQHIEFLEENIDPDSGLLDKLRSNRTLSFKETSDIKDQHPFYKRNSLLLQYIIEKKKYDCLINALIVTGQAHIANFFIGNGEYTPEKFGDEWPLADSKLSALHANYEILVDRIDPGEFVVRLYSKGVINRRQREAISSKLASYEKNEALLEILNRRSLKDFKATIRCLHETNQSHLAQILEEGGDWEPREDFFGYPGTIEFECLQMSIDEDALFFDDISVSMMPPERPPIDYLNFYAGSFTYDISAFEGELSPYDELSITRQSDEELTFTKHLEFLKKNIDPDSGLLDKLRCNKTLSFKETSDIKDLHPFHKRNSLLLQCIIDKRKYDCLIDALKETGQTHIVNFLTGDGEYTAEKFGDEWPLTESQLGVLDVNKQCLRDLLEPDKLVESLFSRGVINRRQREAISSKLTSHEKNEALLEILSRRSLKDFKATIQCLHESNQSHIAEILEEGGAIRWVPAEDEIVREFYKYLTNKSLEESRRILEGVTLNFTSVKKGE